MYKKKLFANVLPNVWDFNGSTNTTKKVSVRKAKMCLTYIFSVITFWILHGKISPK